MQTVLIGLSAATLSASAACHGFTNGGHGFGLRGKGDSSGWPALLEDWLAARARTAPKSGAPVE